MLFVPAKHLFLYLRFPLQRQHTPLSGVQLLCGQNSTSEYICSCHKAPTKEAKSLYNQTTESSSALLQSRVGFFGFEGGVKQLKWKEEELFMKWKSGAAPTRHFPAWDLQFVGFLFHDIIGEIRLHRFPVFDADVTIFFFLSEFH